MKSLILIAALIGFLACFQTGACGAINSKPNIETDKKINVHTVKEVFRNRNNTALEIDISKKIVIHNILEILEMVHLACVKSGPPKGGREVCRKQIANVVSHYLNVIFDVIELYNYMHFNNRINMQDPKHAKNFGKMAANVYGGA